MRRFWLLLLVMVLPLQMSWAAIHYCNDDLGGAGSSVVTSAQPSKAAGDIATANEQRPEGSFGAEAPCTCPCHGVHELPPYAAVRIPEAAATSVLNHSQQRLHPLPFASRHDRPQWSAA